jgi:hypothetical protein
MASELMSILVWPDEMGPQPKQVWVRLLAQVLVPIHAAMRDIGANDFSVIVNRAAVLERTDVDDISDSVPLQDLTAKILKLEKRVSNLEACVIEARVPSREAHFSAAPRSSRTEHVEDDVTQAQRRAARLRSPSPLVRPVHEHATGGYTLLPQSAISKLLASGVIQEEMSGRLVRMPPLWHQPQHNQEAPDLQEHMNPQMQPQMQMQTAPPMLVQDPQPHQQIQPQMPSHMGQQLQPYIMQPQMQPQMPPHTPSAGQQLQPQMQLQMQPQTAPSQSWWPCASASTG